MNIDFSTLYLVSIPGFLVGLLTGRFFSGRRWLALYNRLGKLAAVLKAVSMATIVLVGIVTLGIMAVYLFNLPEGAEPRNFWVTLCFALWIILNLFFEVRDWLAGSRPSFKR